MAAVDKLLPGDLVTQNGQSAVFISRNPHPVYLTLALVIWRLDDNTWSLDALAWNQNVGEVVVSTPKERVRRLFGAFELTPPEGK